MRFRVSASTVAVPVKARFVVAPPSVTVVPRTRPSVWLWEVASARSTVVASIVLRVWAKAPVTVRSQVMARVMFAVRTASVRVTSPATTVTTSLVAAHSPSHPTALVTPVFQVAPVAVRVVVVMATFAFEPTTSAPASSVTASNVNGDSAVSKRNPFATVSVRSSARLVSVAVLAPLASPMSAKVPTPPPTPRVPAVGLVPLVPPVMETPARSKLEVMARTATRPPPPPPPVP
ncbi:MAG: hypothetical protein H6745_01020 [Deltaproteobacteria bacterium]|nr:hypothetical protein [Deltaproteobacteria bacterium]